MFAFYGEAATLECPISGVCDEARELVEMLGATAELNKKFAIGKKCVIILQKYGFAFKVIFPFVCVFTFPPFLI